MNKETLKILIYFVIFLAVVKLFFIYGLIRTDLINRKKEKKEKNSKTYKSASEYDKDKKKRLWRRNNKE